ncbi:MAG: hypothetical protein IT292_08590 [Deltaproteobacteria bacterium]|nr:hypothetical protein [Deltaproteobacteria bacterium]
MEHKNLGSFITYDQASREFAYSAADQAIRIPTEVTPDEHGILPKDQFRVVFKSGTYFIMPINETGEQKHKQALLLFLRFEGKCLDLESSSVILAKTEHCENDVWTCDLAAFLLPGSQLWFHEPNKDIGGKSRYITIFSWNGDTLLRTGTQKIGII